MGQKAAFSPCGRFLLATEWAGDDRYHIRIYNAATGLFVGELVGHRARIAGLAFSSSGVLYSWDHAGVIRRWNVAERRELWRYCGKQAGLDSQGVANRSAQQLRVAILDPQPRGQAAKHMSCQAVMDEGQVFAGLIADATASSVNLHRAEGAEDTLHRSQIEEFVSSGVALLPENAREQSTSSGGVQPGRGLLDVQTAPIQNLLAGLSSAPDNAHRSDAPTAICRAVHWRPPDHPSSFKCVLS